jgi:hypothetical protein
MGVAHNSCSGQRIGGECDASEQGRATQRGPSHLPSTGPLEDIAWTRNPTPGLPACNNQATSCSTSPVSKDVVDGGSAYPIGGGREVRPSVEVIKSAHFLVSEWLSAR